MIKVSIAAALVLAGILAGLLAGPGSALAQGDGRVDPPQSDNVKYAWADVLRVDPLYEYAQISNPREECYEAPGDQRGSDQRGPDNRAGGTVLGAIVGGVLGNTLGKGDGRRAATVAGAVVGGAVGNNIASNNDQRYSGTETRCRVVRDRAQERRITGYDVQYRYRGDVYLSRLDYDPGERMRVRISVTPAE
ncbi:MAG: glycine zipper 2TM domain-containing protein [Dokdonella sp.]